MNRTGVLIVSTTFYKSVNELRFRIALNTFSYAIKEGYSVLVVDGSPDPEIRESFEAIGVKVIVEKDRGIGPSRRQLFRFVLESRSEEIILWTEPEKFDLIGFVEAITKPITENTCDISIPVRSKKSLETYPKFQVMSEMVANHVFQEATGISADPMFGPVAFNRKALGFFVECFPGRLNLRDNYIQIIAPIQALVYGGLRILSPGVEIDFKYPKEQCEEEEGPFFREMVYKRLQQLDELVRSFVVLGRLMERIR